MAIGRAVAAAASAASRGRWTAGADVAARIAWATGLVAGLPEHQVLATVYRLVGTSLATQESVPAAFAVAAAIPGDPWLACRLAASLGGDCDTIAAMTGAICGACHGAVPFPPPPGRRWPASTAWTSARSPMICLPYGAPGMTSPFTRLLHLGNVVVDVVLDVPALPEPGGNMLATRSQTAAGGGFNVMAAAARLGLAVASGVDGQRTVATLARAACARRSRC